MVRAKIILDSNIWIGYFNQKDSLHKKSVKIVEDLSAVYVPEYVVLETVSILKMKSGSELANICLGIFTDSLNINVIPSTSIFNKTIKLFQTLNDKHLSFVDMSLLALSRDYEVKTFDKKLASAIMKYSL